MAPSTHSTQPIQTLRETVVLLGASIRDCLRHPGKAAVHKLRTTTRRIEAELELLSLLPSLPPHQQQKLAAFDLLKRLRHAAARVRDIDVQLDLLRKEAIPASGDTGAHHRKELLRLRLALKRKRDEHAGSLHRLLRKRQTDVQLAFDDLLDTLAPAESTSLAETDLITLVRNWYNNGNQPHSPASAHDGATELHNIRKRAKLARYLAESAPPSAAKAHRLAARFERLQQAGGAWHDWLLLAELAARKLGDSAQLPPRFAAQAERSLHTYKRQLNHKI
jgi:CHAD domain-containing protein